MENTLSSSPPVSCVTKDISFNFLMLLFLYEKVINITNIDQFLLCLRYYLRPSYERNKEKTMPM